MSFLKEIMDVDIEPLESQARGSRAKAQEHVEDGQTIPSNSQRPRESLQGYRDDSRDPSLTLWKSNCFSESLSMNSSAGLNLGRHFRGETVGSMEYDSRPMGPNQSATHPDSSKRQFSRSINQPDLVKLTPVTGRVSRAKKGQPVHICELCQPPRVFTRAEHLRRHNLGHQKAAYRCTFEDCEKAFHRPDLLARHINRHEIQGEEASRTGDGGSMSPSSSLASDPPHLEIQQVINVGPANGARLLPIPDIIPRAAQDGISRSSGQSLDREDTLLSITRPSNHGTGHTSPFDRDGTRIVSAGPSSTTFGSAVSGIPRHGFTGSASSTCVNNGQTYSDQHMTWQIHTVLGRVDPERLRSVKVPDRQSIAAAKSMRYSPDYTWSKRTPRPWTENRPASTTRIPQGSNLPISWSQLNDSDKFQTAQTPTKAVSDHNLSRPHPELAEAGSRTYPIPSSYGFSPLIEASNVVLLTESMDEYIISYWASLEPVYAIIHPATFNVNPSQAVRDAMAALGSQFHNLPEDRENGSRLHDVCKRNISKLQGMTFQKLQAIYLTEVFGRFRSEKIDVRPSDLFHELYKMLVECGETDSQHMFSRLNFQELSTFVDMQHKTKNKAGSSISFQQVIDGIWRQWIEYEVRQRLRAACFMFDAHQSFCYEQQRCEPHINADNMFLVIPCPTSLWKAASSEQWYGHIRNFEKCPAVRITHPEKMTPEQISHLPLSAQADVLASLLVLLKPRGDISSLNPSINAELVATVTRLYPHFIHCHATLALYHTPLHQLLLLTGNTWIFGQKLTSQSDIDAIVPAIKRWASSTAAARAAWHACHVLRHLLTACYETTKPFRGVSEYWYIYCCTLIIWAFGHAHPPTTTIIRATSQQQPSPPASEWSPDKSPSELREVAETWTAKMIGHEPEGLFEAEMRGETRAVVDAVRWKLRVEADMSHGRTGILTDACGVLDRIRDGRRLF